MNFLSNNQLSILNHSHEVGNDLRQGKLSGYTESIVELSMVKLIAGYPLIRELYLLLDFSEVNVKK